MNAIRTIAWCAMAGLVLALSEPAVGQHVRPLTGNAIDASNQIGSGGLNPATPTYNFNAANLFVTGNVAGGRQFRGFSPVRDPSSLFSSMPSGGIGSFQADAISVQDVLAGRTNYSFSPYYDRSQTVLGAGAIGRGLNAPGSSIPRTTSLYGSSTRGLGTRMGDPLPFAGTGTYSLSSPPLDTYPWPSSTFTPYSSIPLNPLEPKDAMDAAPLTQSPLFAPSTLQQLAGTPETPGLLPPRPDAGLPGTWQREDTERRLPAAPSLLGGDRDLLGASELAPRIFGVPGADRDLVDPLRSSIAAAPIAPSTILPSPAGETPEGDLTRPFAPTGLSVYADFVSAAEWLERVGEAAAGEGEVSADAEAATERARALVGSTLRTYAGDVESNVNRLIVNAELAARHGDFYRAADLYASAARIDRHNPLIRLGHGHTLFFAGDYLSATFHLTRGLRDFEMLPYFDVDLSAFAPDPNLLDIRRADLERRLEQQENYRLRFLLGYAEYYSGVKQFGLPNLRKAAEDANRALSAERLDAADRLTAEVIAGLPDRLTPAEPSPAPEE
ncbi:MAG: hypothetical protein JXB13_19345 [Phycisphaerae bacterium]|nr:hypothetical protein [Phycisphaerae bacterium]